MKKDKGRKAIIGISLLLTVLVFVVPILIKMLYEMPAPFKFMEIIDSNTYEAWIGYYGAICGGALTLIGVWWTIKFESERLKSKVELEKITKFFPTISAQVISSNSVNDVCSCLNIKINNHFFIGEEQYGDYLIGLRNIGQSEVYIDSIVLDSFNISNVINGLTINSEQLEDYYNADGELKYIPPGETFFLKMGYSIPFGNIEKYLQKEKEVHFFTFHYSFILNIGGVLTEDDPFQYFLSYSVDVFLVKGKQYKYKIYNITLGR